MTATTPLTVALECAARGWHVFPAKADKTPWTKHGFKDATRDEAKIRQWWKARPVALVGIATGASGLLVVDLDVKNGAVGTDEWAAIVERLGPHLEDTAMVETPSGGMHVYYSVNGAKPMGNTASKLAPGIDTRGDGGYVIAGGSDGYLYVEGHGPERILALPNALRSLLESAQAPTSGKAAVVGPVIPAGQRDATLASLAGTMRRRGMSADAIYAALAAENEASCQPPLEDAQVRKIAESVARYAPLPELPGTIADIAVAREKKADPTNTKAKGNPQAEVQTQTIEAPAATAEMPFEDIDDTGNAMRFIRLYGHMVRYCDIEGRWYVYDGVKWSPDEVLLVADLMRRALVGLFEDAARASDSKRSEAIGKWASKSMSAISRRHALENARSDPRVSVHPSQFDRGNHLLNCSNGTLDLRTGELRPHRPEDLLRKVTHADYDPEVRSELWERVVSAALGDDAEFVAGFKRACGYCATGDTSEEVFFILHGPTHSVKSTVCDALAATLGDYVHATAAETWLERDRVGGTRGDLVDLDGVRVAISAETQRKIPLAVALIKAFTGGDPIVANEKYQRNQTMIPTAKIWLHTNDVPRMPDNDDAVWRRAVIFPFNHPPAHPDKRIKKLLSDPEQCGSGILTWVVEGYNEWRRQGLDVPAAARAETLAVRIGMDPLQSWWDECCEQEEGARTSNTDLRASYEMWRKHYSVRYSVGAREWGERMTARGLVPYRSNGVRGWVGVALTGAETQTGIGC